MQYTQRSNVCTVQYCTQCVRSTHSKWAKRHLLRNLVRKGLSRSSKSLYMYVACTYSVSSLPTLHLSLLLLQRSTALGAVCVILGFLCPYTTVASAACRSSNVRGLTLFERTHYSQMPPTSTPLKKLFSRPSSFLPLSVLVLDFY